MPGPRNSNKKGQKGSQKAKRTALRILPQNVQLAASIIHNGPKSESKELIDAPTVSYHDSLAENALDDTHSAHEDANTDALQTSVLGESQIMPIPLPKALPEPTTSTPLAAPFITNPGTGPRVQDTVAYLSSFFAPPPAYHDPLSAYLAQPQVPEWLTTLLPYELALVGTPVLLPCYLY